MSSGQHDVLICIMACVITPRVREALWDISIQQQQGFLSWLSVLQVVLERLYEPFNRVNEARYGTNAPNNENGDIKEHMVP